MKKIVLCLLLALCFSVCSAAEVHVTSVRADFVQEKHLEMLVQPIRSSGKFYFQAPASLRWEYTAPVASLLLMHADQIKKYVKVDGVYKNEPGQSFGSMQFIMGEISSWLDGRFTDNDIFTVHRLDATHIELIPRPGSLEGIISKIDLTLADQQGLLESVTIHEGEGTYTIMHFTNRELNTKLPQTLFTAP